MNGQLFGLGLLRYFTLLHTKYITWQTCKRYCWGEYFAMDWVRNCGRGEKDLSWIDIGGMQYDG